MNYGIPLEEFLSPFKVYQAWQNALERVKGLKEGEHTELPDGRIVVRLATKIVMMPKPLTTEYIMKELHERQDCDALQKYLDDSFKFDWRLRCGSLKSG